MFTDGDAVDSSYSYKPNLNPSCPGCGLVNSNDPKDGTGTYNDATFDATPARTAFKFDVSSIPTGSTVTAADLNLYIAGCPTNPPSP